MNSAVNSGYSNFFALGPDSDQSRARRAEELQRQIHDQGLSYNIYGPDHRQQHVWSLELFPLLVPEHEWLAIEQGICQRAGLLEQIAQNIYSNADLLKKALLPGALIYGHPGYLPDLHDHSFQNGSPEFLQIIAFDLARQPDGNWLVLSQRTQAPSGLGYALANRQLISRQHADAFQALQVRPWTHVVRSFIKRLGRLHPDRGAGHIALLTPGRFHDTYFEQVFLARQFGLTLVEGHDLVVRNNQVFLKTLKGLERIHILLKRLDDAFLDPLSLRSDSTLGTPGLINAYCAGEVGLINAPGMAFLESPALLGFLPGISETLNNEKLLIPSVDTWWCGEEAARRSGEKFMGNCLIKPTYGGTLGERNFETVVFKKLSISAQEHWRQHIQEDPEAYTLQTSVPLMTMPVWRQGMHSQPFMLRVFALRMGERWNQWQIVPGGMARVVGDQNIASMQQGGSSADVWVIPSVAGPATRTVSTMDAPLTTLSYPPIVHRGVTSRAAENLFWMGRYTERSENSLRLAQVYLDSLLAETPMSTEMTHWIENLWERLGPQLSENQTKIQAIVESLARQENPQSLGFNLGHLKNAAAAVRERLSEDHWQTIETCSEELIAHEAQSLGKDHPERSVVTTLKTLKAISRQLASITGAQSDRMLRDEGWQLLMIGRLIERLTFLSDVMITAARSGVLPDSEGEWGSSSMAGVLLTGLLDIAPGELSPLTFYPTRQRCVDLIIFHDQNPRSLTWVTNSLRKRLSKLAQTPFGEPDALAQLIGLPSTDALEQTTLENKTLANWLDIFKQSAYLLSDRITAQYFVHVHTQDTSLGG